MTDPAIPRSSPSSSVHALQSALLDMYPHRSHVSVHVVNEGCAGEHNIALTLHLLRRLHLLPHLERLARVDDVDDCTGPCGL